MNRLSSVALALGLSLLAGSCDEAAAPKGRPGTVIVAAYVDRDGSGTFTASDSALAGVQVNLMRDGQQVAQGTTGSDGRVEFEEMAPGSYRAELAAGAPAGAVLVTNPTPSAVVNFRGDSARVDFRFSFFPGSLTGRIFRDDDADGVFDAGELAGAGLYVLLKANDNGAPGATLDSVTTDAEGVYTFARVAPGTYFLEFQQLGAMNYGAEGTTRQVTVAPQGAVTSTVLFTGSIFNTVAEARAAAIGTTVAVRGVLTVPAGIFTSDSSGVVGVRSEVWVQDETGGIAVFPVATSDSTTLRLGTRVEVVGTRQANAQAAQIGNLTSYPTIRAIGTAAVPVPVELSVAEARAAQDEGELVRVDSLTVRSVSTPNTIGAFNVVMTGPADDTLQLRIHRSTTGLTAADFVVGDTYVVTGILTRFNATMQIKPRYATDVTPQPTGPPGVARVIINEIMPNPNAVSDNLGEYIELHNWGTAPANLQGWTIRDAFPNIATIDIPLVIPAGGYALLAVNGDAGTNGGLPPVDFVYPSSVSQNQTSDVIVLKDASGATVDSISWATSTATAAGIARGVLDPSGDNSDVLGANWAQQTSTYGAGDRGTPKAQNDGYIDPNPPPQAGPRISEIHYDNNLGDVGEAIEVSAPAGTDLTGWTLVLYNGNNSAMYGTQPIGGVVPATCGGRGVLVVNYPANGIQNGAPDGVALVNAAGTVVEFLSYEGVITAVDGPALGMTSTDIGVLEVGNEPEGMSLQRLPDGTWTGPVAATFGACND